MTANIKMRLWFQKKYVQKCFGCGNKSQMHAAIKREWKKVHPPQTYLLDRTV